MNLFWIFTLISPTFADFEILKTINDKIGDYINPHGDAPPIGDSLSSAMRLENRRSIAESFRDQAAEWAVTAATNLAKVATENSAQFIKRTASRVVRDLNAPARVADRLLSPKPKPRAPSSRRAGLDTKTMEEKEDLLAESQGKMSPGLKRDIITSLKTVAGLTNMVTNIGSTQSLTPLKNFAEKKVQGSMVKEIAEELPGVDLNWDPFQKSISIQGATSVMNDYLGVLRQFLEDLQEGIDLEKRGLIEWHVDEDFRLKRCDGSTMRRKEFVEEYLMRHRLDFIEDLEQCGILPNNDIWEDPKRVKFSVVLAEVSHGWYYTLLYAELLSEDGTRVTFVIPCKHFLCKLAYAQVSSCDQ